MKKLNKTLHGSSVKLSCDVFATCSWTSQLKHLLFEVFLPGNPPTQLSEVGVLDKRSMNKKTPRRSVT